MLQWRLLATAAVLGPLFLLIWLDDQWNGGRPGIWMCSLAVLISGLAADELSQILKRAQFAVSRNVNGLAVLCVTGCSLAPLLWTEYPTDCPISKLGWTVVGVAAAVAVVFSAELIRFQEPGESIQRISGGCLCITYVGVMISCLIQLRLTQPGRMGLIAVLATLFVVKLSDTGAFFTGKSIGRTKLCLVSPKKTVEGVLGGVVFAVGGACFVYAVVLPYLAPQHPRGSVWVYAGFGATMAFAGLLGDLSESVLKRDVQQKDSSTWLRGLGGVLDIIDSLLAAAPASLVWWSTGWL